MNNSTNRVPALELRHVSKRYGQVQAVKDLSFEIREGEIFGLLGPNGAGKSTTINMISGLTRLSSGSIRVFGFDVVSEYTTTRRLVGLMHQEVVIDNFFRIGRALSIHSGYYGYKDDPEWRELLLEKLALKPHVRKKGIQLSGGMRRRVMLAKALIHKPRLLILDEPTAGVDVELRLTLWDFVREINRQGTTVLLTTHYLEEAQEMCDRIAIMNNGELVALDTTRALLNTLNEKFLKLHLGAPLKTVPEGLARFNAELFDGGSTIRFSLGTETPVNEILKAVLAQPQVRVEGIETNKAELEQVFLKLTHARSPAR
jgi:ABC-2 type transport system ATP-binding protein